MRYLLLVIALFCAFSAVPVMAQEEPDEECNMEAMEMEWGLEDGMIVHTEIYVTDLEKAAEFYSTLFGWEFNEEQEDYWSFMTPGFSSGGITNIAPGGPGGTLVYIHSSDIDAKLQEIVDAGGEVFMEKTEIEGTGAFALFGDLDGNLLGLFTM